MRIYRYRDLKPAGVPFTRKHVSYLEKAGQFPRHFDIGENTVGWIADEVDGWVEEKIRHRRAISPRSE
jgi:predicted DNA-binding transcriptional regulator AlpA